MKWTPVVATSIACSLLGLALAAPTPKKPAEPAKKPVAAAPQKGAKPKAPTPSKVAPPHH